MAEPMNEELLRVVEADMAKWVRERIKDLPEKAHPRAINAVRCLYWAGGIATLEDTNYHEGERGYRVPATFFLMHALEEAVAALVKTAEKSGYRKLANKVYIRDHYHKTTLSWLCTEVVNSFIERRLALSFNTKNDLISLNVEQDGETIYRTATLGRLELRGSDEEAAETFLQILIDRYGGEEVLAQEVKRMGNLRNELLYATDTGVKTGPLDLEKELKGMSKTTMGVLWAAVDISAHENERAPMIEEVFKTTVALKKLAFPPEKRSCTETK